MNSIKSGTKVLVTGGAGFIGSHLVEDLLEMNCEVRLIDNFFSGKQRNIEGLGAGKYKPNIDFEVIREDIRNTDALLKSMNGIEIVLHQAAMGSVPRSVEDPLTTNDVNAGGTLNVFWAAHKMNVKRVVYASSSSVYGDSELLPKKEGEEGKALSPYALSKQINEQYSRLFGSLYKLETVGLRYFNVYGPRQDPDSQYAAVIPRFCTALLAGKQPIIYGTGEQSRDFTYVKDVVKANIAAANAPEAAVGKAFNIGRGSSSTLLELLSVLKNLLHSSIEPIFDPPRAGDVMHSSADTSQTREYLGFSADCELQEGLENSIEWYRANL